MYKYHHPLSGKTVSTASQSSPEDSAVTHSCTAIPFPSPFPLPRLKVCFWGNPSSDSASGTKDYDSSTCGTLTKTGHMPSHKVSTYFKRLKSYEIFLTQLQLSRITRKIPICLEIKKYNFRLLNNLRSMIKAKEPCFVGHFSAYY